MERCFLWTQIPYCRDSCDSRFMGVNTIKYSQIRYCLQECCFAAYTVPALGELRSLSQLLDMEAQFLKQIHKVSISHKRYKIKNPFSRFKCLTSLSFILEIVAIFFWVNTYALGHSRP